MKNKFVIIGAGNTANFFAKALMNAGHEISQVIARDSDKGKDLAQLYNCVFENEISEIDVKAEFCILATSDDSLGELAIEVRKYFTGILLHCSGSCPLSVLNSVKDLPHGVIYPLQTISSTDLPNSELVPMLIEGNSKDTLDIIEQISIELGSQIHKINSAQRLKLHLAAVMVSNFCNHLYLKAEELIKSTNLDFELLHPLMQETLRKAIQNGPYNSQTGPARRNDLHTMQKHLGILHDDMELANLYKLISDSIVKTYS